MVSVPITSWQTEGEKWKPWPILFSWAAPKSLQTVTAATKWKYTCFLEGKLWKTYHIKKQRHHFANKGLYRQSYGFPVVMYGCESWTVKKAECQRIDDFELWCWRRLLRVPWSARRSNQSILKEISPEYSLEGLMLKLQHLATWCKELTHWKDPGAGKDWWQEDKWATEDEMVGWHHQLNAHEF